MPDDAHRKLRAEAALRGISLEDLLKEILLQHLADQEKRAGKK